MSPTTTLHRRIPAPTTSCFSSIWPTLYRSPARRSLLFRRCVRTPPEKTGRSNPALALSPADKEKIKSMLPQGKPRKLRTEEDIFEALRKIGYRPAIDRIDEMLDMKRSPYQKRDLFDNITLGLLLRTAKTVDGGIRNPYRIPGIPAGQNPVVTRTGSLANYNPALRHFLLPDDTNWAYISHLFPLPHPPRPKHPIVMSGNRQEYTKEEVARRLEWSMVRNAKGMRNGYGYQTPDPEKWESLSALPPPPPPVIRACNVCRKPRYLMRFWNFYYQIWQHVSSPHRPMDCASHRTGTTGRLMFCPPGSRIDGHKPSLIEDKEWIEEETAIKLLYRSGFIELPKVTINMGKLMTQASINSSDIFEWIKDTDIQRWGMRGGRENGLVDLTNVKRLEKVEAARIEQQAKFLEREKETIKIVSDLLLKNPIREEVPEGYLYPKDHPCAKHWTAHLQAEHAARMRAITEAANRKKELKEKIKQRLTEYRTALEEMRLTQAQIILLQRGEGESWAEPQKHMMSLEARLKDNAGKRPAPFSRWNVVQNSPLIPSNKKLQHLKEIDPEAYETEKELRRSVLKQQDAALNELLRKAKEDEEDVSKGQSGNRMTYDNEHSDISVLADDAEGAQTSPTIRWGAALYSAEPRNREYLGRQSAPVQE